MRWDSVSEGITKQDIENEINFELILLQLAEFSRVFKYKKLSRTEAPTKWRSFNLVPDLNSMRKSPHHLHSTKNSNCYKRKNLPINLLYKKRQRKVSNHV